LDSALKFFARQSRLYLIYAQEDVINHHTAGVTGELTAEQTLDRLLKDTGLTYRFLDDKTITIVPIASAPASDKKSILGKTSWVGSGQRFSLAQSEEVSPSRRPESAEGIEIEEIIVTAQKREQKLIDVPLSITALSGADLHDRNITKISDIAAAVPGLVVFDNGPGNRRIALRGVGNLVGGSSLTGLYLDEADVTGFSDAIIDLRPYDLARVEVLRGPQGTLYGEGSTSGTIRFITRDVNLEAVEASAEVAGYQTRNGSPSESFTGVINLPLSGQFGLRIGGFLANEGGWIDQPSVGRSEINDQTLRDVRVKALWQASDSLALSAMAIVHRNDAGLGNQSADENLNFSQAFLAPVTPATRDDYEVYNLTVNGTLSNVNIVSTSSLLEIDKHLDNYGNLLALLPPPLPPLNFLYDSVSDGRIFSQELRANSQVGALEWTLGAFYRDASTTRESNALLGFSEATARGIHTLAETGSRSWATFGELSYSLTERLEAGAGLRYFRDRREQFNGISTQTATFDSVNPRVFAKYDVTDAVNVYLNVAKGFRSGGFNAVGQPTYDPESLWSYELGTKTSGLAGGRLSAELAIYYSQYRDIQVIGAPTGSLQTVTTNLSAATIQGVDLNAAWRFDAHWQLGASANYVDTRVDEIGVTHASHNVGDGLDGIPHYGYSAWLDTDFNWTPSVAGFARVDYSGQGRSIYRDRAIGDFFYSTSDVLDTLNLRVGAKWTDVSFEVFAENVLDDIGYTDPFGIQGIAGRQRPRTIGLRARWQVE
jgi:outer membrane receptor protein involved in Fe transport